MAYYYSSELYFGVNPLDFMGGFEGFLLSEGEKLVKTNYHSSKGDVLLSIGRRSDSDRVTTLHLPTAFGRAKVSKLVSEFRRLHNIVTLELCYLEDFWEAILRQGEMELDRFSTLPHFQESEPKAWLMLRGDPQLVAEKCGVPYDMVTSYYRWWQTPHDMQSRKSSTPTGAESDDLVKLSGKAQVGDLYEYGQAGQVFDFAQRIGGCGHVNDSPEWNFFEILHD